MEETGASAALQKIRKICSASPQQMMHNYDEWASEYEKDTFSIGYQVPRDGADVMMKYLPGGKEAKVLDVACGTGLVAERMRATGFKGTLHGVDGSEKMIKIARKKSVYDQIFYQYMLPGKKVLAHSDEKYNGVTCIGAFLGGHLDPKILPDLSDLLQPGGVLVYSARVGASNDMLVKLLEEEERKLVKASILVRIGVFKAAHGVNWDKKKQSADVASSDLNIYCLKKL